MSEKEFTLAAREVYKSYPSGDGRQAVLDGINFTMEGGGSAGIVGVSGAGKSTLLHLLGGLARPDLGSVELNGRDMSSLSAAEAGRMRNLHLGFVYQFHHLLAEFTALENAAMPLYARRLPSSECTQIAMEALEKVGLANHAGKPPGRLSGGERQRAAIARAIAGSPNCIIADEPTGNLDRKTATRVFDLLLQLNDESGVALILASHDEGLISQLSRRFALIDGKLTE